MYARSKTKDGNQKTCWSVLINAFSSLNKSQLLLGYLFLSANVLAAPMKSSSTRITYFLNNGEKVEPKPSEEVWSNRPNCAVTHNPNLGNEVKQACQNKYPEIPFETQLESGTFVGDRFKDWKLTVTVSHSRDPNAAVATEYDFTRSEDVVVVTSNTYENDASKSEFRTCPPNDEKYHFTGAEWHMSKLYGAPAIQDYVNCRYVNTSSSASIWRNAGLVDSSAFTDKQGTDWVQHNNGFECESNDVNRCRFGK